MNNCIKCDKYTQTENDKLKCNLFEIMHITKMLNNKEKYKEEEKNEEYTKQKKIILIKKIVNKK